MAEENPLAQFRSSTSAAPSDPDAGGNPLAQFRSQPSTKGEPTALDEDPRVGVETALRNTWNYATNVAQAVREELLLGYGSEKEAIISATFKYILAGGKGKSWGQIYDDDVSQTEKGLKEFSEKNPKVAGLATATGMLIPAGLTMGAAMGPTAVRVGAKTAGKATTEALKRPNFFRRSAQGTAAGAGYGAVYGSGKAEGGIEDRLAGAVEPGAVGAGMGAAVPIVGALARPAIAHLIKRGAAKRAGIERAAVDPLQETLESGAEGVAGEVKEPLPDSIWADLYADTRGLLSESLVRLGRFGKKVEKK